MLMVESLQSIGLVFGLFTLINLSDVAEEEILLFGRQALEQLENRLLLLKPVYI